MKTLTHEQITLAMNGLAFAAESYRDLAKMTGDVTSVPAVVTARIRDQFRRQAAMASELSEMFSAANSVTIS